MNHTAQFRPHLWKAVALNVGYTFAVLLAACGFRHWRGGSTSSSERGSDGEFTSSALALRTTEEGGSGEASGREHYKLYGAKTSYDEVREKSVEEVNISGCAPKQFWLLSRHGARYPGPWEMDALLSRLPAIRNTIVQNSQVGRGHLTEEEISRFANWKMEFHPNLDNQLTPWGEKEMKELGEVRIPKPLKDDPIIKFYKTCRKWREEVDDNVDSRKERERFRGGPEMEKVVLAVSRRLGYEKTLGFDDVHLMFTMCRFENATHPGRQSPWCSVFRRNEIEVMEYDEDLDYYWTDGYGYPINYEQACPPIKDFLDHFRAAMKSESDAPLGVFRFTHSGLMLKVYARLGLFRDATAPTADNFRQQTSRQWRSSLIDPFTANLALVLFKCSDGYKLLAYVQEKEVVLPGCDNILCPMETVLANYGALADTCNVGAICDGHLENYPYCRRQRPTKNSCSSKKA